MLNYSNASGVEYAGLTDGNHWELYEVFQRGQLEDRRILDVSIADTPAHQCALQLLLLWRPNLAAGKPVAANRPIWLGEKELNGGDPPPPPPPAQGWIELSEYKPTGGASPPIDYPFFRRAGTNHKVLVRSVDEDHGMALLQAIAHS